MKESVLNLHLNGAFARVLSYDAKLDDPGFSKLNCLVDLGHRRKGAESV